MSAHAYLPPSGADEWVACAMWPEMNRRFPDLGDETASIEGTLAHATLQARIEGQPEPPGATDEMREAAQLVVDHLSTLPVPTWTVERRLTGTAIHDSQNWGTPDLIGWHGMTLYVGDFKFGHGYVEHVRNLQCLNYAILEIDRAVREDGIDLSALRVVITIYQPRCFTAAPIRQWSCSGVEVLEVRADLRAAAIAATRLDRKATTGPQCKHCNGRHACDALRDVAHLGIEVSRQVMPMDVGLDAIGRELRVLQDVQERLAARISGYEEHVQHALKSGKTVPGWALQPSAGRERWVLPSADVIALYGQQFAKPPEAITPTQAIQRKLAPPEVIKAISERPAGAVKLVRAEAAAAKAAEVFKP